MDQSDPSLSTSKKILLASVGIVLVVIVGLVLVQHRGRVQKSTELPQTEDLSRQTPFPKPKYFAALVRDGKIYLYSQEANQEEVLKDSQGQEVTYDVKLETGLAFSASNRYLLWQNRDGALYSFDLVRRQKTTLTSDKIVAGVLSDTQDSLALLTAKDGLTRFLDLTGQQATRQVKLRAFPLAFSPDNRTLLTRRLKAGKPQQYTYYLFSLADASETKLHDSPNLSATTTPVWLPDASGIIANEGDKLTLVPVDIREAKTVLADTYGVVLALSPVKSDGSLLIGALSDDKLLLILVSTKSGETKILAALPEFDRKKETIRLGLMNNGAFWLLRAKRNTDVFTVQTLAPEDGRIAETLTNVNRFAFSQ